MATRSEPVFFIVTQSQNNHPRVFCHACGESHYWGKARQDVKRRGVFYVECKGCRLKRVALKMALMRNARRR